MAQRGRSARTRSQRLARRQSEVRGFDRGGGRRSIFKSRFAKIFYVVGLVGLLGSLIPLLLVSGGHVPAVDPNAPPPVRRVQTNTDIGAVEGKPSFGEPPAMALDPGVDYRATITMEDGSEIQIDLFEDLAPEHTNNFVFLAREGFYDDLTFHRVVDNFVAQAGDPEAGDPTATGTHGAGYTLPDEPLTDANQGELSLDEAGILAMARGGAGASSSQFFITITPQGGLDSQGFTAFGRVTSGLETVGAFPARDPEAFPAPEAGPRIEAITIEELDAESQGEAGSEDPGTDESAAGGGEAPADQAEEPSAQSAG